MIGAMLTPPAALEAVLFASGEPLEKKYLAALLGITESNLARVIVALMEQLKERGVALIETTDEVELRTSAEAADFVRKLREGELSRDLGKASLETLAIIAYHSGSRTGKDDGVTRGDIDWVRGVNSSTSVRTLLMRGLIEGREDLKDKRRVRYFLTTETLAHLGITRVQELPRFAELAAEARAAANGAESIEPSAIV